MSAPHPCAARILVGEKQPGIGGTSRSWHAAVPSERNTGLTTNDAPASITARAVTGSITVPAPSRNPAGSAGASSRISSIARGTVIVSSSARTPPSAIASTTARSFAGSFRRMTATTPSISTCAVTAARLEFVTVVIGPFVGERSGQLRAPALGRRVGGHAPAALEREYRRDVDDLPSALGQHVPPRRAAQPEHAREIHLDDRVPVGVAVRLGLGTEDEAGVIDDDIETTQTPENTHNKSIGRHPPTPT